MIFIPIVALIIGILLGLFVAAPIRGILGTYMAVACLAGLDSVCGGIRSAMESKFHTDVFLTGFISNILITFFLAWLGDRIGINLFLAAALVLGSRIFLNLSLIRRYLLNQWAETRRRRTEQAQNSAQTTAQQVNVT